MKRSNFYPNGEFIPYQMPQDFRQALGKEACGNCGMYSLPRNFCGVYRTKGVKDNFVISGEKDILKDNGFNIIKRWNLLFDRSYQRNDSRYRIIK